MTLGRPKNLVLLGVSAGLACIALLVATESVSEGQGEVKKPDVVGLVGRDYRFEVASVRPATAPNGLEYMSGHEGYSPRRFRETNTSLSRLAYEAFRPKFGFQLKYPNWMDSAYFTVDAVLPNGATKADIPLMIQHLLEERFGLIYHHETRLQSGYELLVAKSGSRLSMATPSTPSSTAIQGDGIEVKNGVPRFTDAAGSGQLLYGSTVTWRGRSKTTDGLAADLGNNLHLPVTDATGLAGQYDYTLTFTAGTNSPFAVAPSPGEDVPAGATPQPAYPFFFDALKQELGLYLQPAKNIPVDVTVIDHANKEPTPN